MQLNGLSNILSLLLFTKLPKLLTKSHCSAGDAVPLITTVFIRQILIHKVIICGGLASISAKVNQRALGDCILLSCINYIVGHAIYIHSVYSCQSIRARQAFVNFLIHFSSWVMFISPKNFLINV